jgi:hypothetical protein
MTMADLRAGLQAGRKLVLWRGLVIDIGRFMGCHPGGTFLIERNLGEDITSWIAGMESADETASHVHSPFAVQLLLRMVVGAVRASADELMWGPSQPAPGSPAAVAAARAMALGGAGSRLGMGVGLGRHTSRGAMDGTASTGGSWLGGLSHTASRPQMQLAGEAEIKAAVGAPQSFSMWTLVSRTTVAVTRSGPVLRLEFSHPYLSSQGQGVSAALWSLASMGRYVMVRVPLRDLDRHLRKLARRDAKAAYAAHAAAEAAASAAAAAVPPPGRRGQPRRLRLVGADEQRQPPLPSRQRRAAGPWRSESAKRLRRSQQQRERLLYRRRERHLPGCGAECCRQPCAGAARQRRRCRHPEPEQPSHGPSPLPDLAAAAGAGARAQQRAGESPVPHRALGLLDTPRQRGGRQRRQQPLWRLCLSLWRRG